MKPFTLEFEAVDVPAATGATPARMTVRAAPQVPFKADALRVVQGRGLLLAELQIGVFQQMAQDLPPLPLDTPPRGRLDVCEPGAVIKITVLNPQAHPVRCELALDGWTV